MKTKLLSFLLLLPVLLIVAALAGPSFIDWNKYKPEIIKQAKDKAGFDVTIDGDISLSVLPSPTVSIQSVSVKNSADDIVKIETAKVSVALFPLLSKQVKIDDIELVHPTISLAIDKDGKGNWENDILSAPKEKSDDGKKSALNGFSIDDLIVTDGVLVFGNAQTGALHKVEAINIDAELESLEGPFSGEFFFKYNGREYDVSGAVETLSDMNKIPVDLAVALDGGDVVASFKGDISSETQAAMGSFSVKGSDISQYAGSHAKGAFNASGNVDYKNNNIKVDDLKASLAGLDFTGDVSHQENAVTLNLKETSKKAGQGLLGAVLSGANAKATIEMNEKSVSFPSYDMSLKDSHLKGSGKYHFTKGLTLNLEANRLDVDAWQSLLPKKSTGGASGGNKVTGFSIPMSSEIFVNVGQLKYDGKSYENIVVDVMTTKNAMTIRKIGTSTAHSTNVAVKGKIGDTQALKDLDLKASLKTADADALLKDYKINRDAYAEKIGALDVDVAINGALDNIGFSTKVHNNGLTVTVSGLAKDPMGKRELKDIALRLQHANLVNAIKLAQPSFSMDRAWQKPLDLSLGLNMGDNQISITSIKGKAGLFPIESGALSVNTGGTVPALSGNLALGSVVLPTTESKKGSSSSKGGSKWSNDPIDTAWMSAFTADLDLKAKKLAQNKWVFDTPSLGFDVKDGVLSVSDLKADMFSGSASVSIKAVAAQGGKGFSNVSLKADTKDLNAKSLYSAVKGKNTDMLNGEIKNASKDVTTSGASMASLVNNLTGKASVNGERLVVNGVDVVSFARAINGDFRGLNSLSDLNNSVLFKGKTEFDTLNGQFDIAKGIVKLNPVTLDGAKAIFDVTGTLDLPKWWLDVKNSVAVKGDGDDVPPFEMTFRGSLDNPVKSAGGDALQGLVKNKLGKLLGDNDLSNTINDKLGLDKLGIDLLGGGKKKETAPAPENNTEKNTDGETNAQPIQEQQKQVTPEDVINDAVGNALGGLLNGL